MGYPDRKRRTFETDDERFGVFFTTVCVRRRIRCLGRVVEGSFVPTDLGRIVDEEWANLPTRFEGVRIWIGQTMPEHHHGIIAVAHVRLSTVIGSFKSRVTYRGRQEGAWLNGTQLWQRSFDRRRIRSRESLERCFEYIRRNPENY